MRSYNAARDVVSLLTRRYSPTRPPLPASAVDYWHAGYGIGLTAGTNEIAAWTSQIRSIAVTTPTIGTSSLFVPDGSNFGGVPAVQSFISGSRFLRTPSAVSAIFAAGTRPYMFVCGRLRTPYASGFPGIAAITSVGSVNSPSILSATNSFACYCASGGAASALENPAPGAPIVLEGFLDASGFTQLSRMGLLATPYSGAGAQTIPADAVNVAFGSTYAGAVSDSSLVCVVLCSSVPTDAERAALRDWAYTEWKFSPSYERILGPLLVALWHSQVGVTASGGNAISWADRIAAASLPAPGVPTRPPYAADGSYFAGKPVVQATITGSKILYASALTALAPINSRPWLFTYGRFRDSAGSNETAVSGGGTGRSVCVRDYFGNFGGGDITTLGVNSGVLLNFVPHSMEDWADGTLCNFQLDAVKYSSAYTQDLQDPLTRVCVGASGQAGGGAGFANYSSAIIAFASSYPGALAAAQVRALAVAEFSA